ncbi:hypothetical protein [Microcoleus sp. PH2017_09_SFU_O_A]|uniref:hypothetical protein n=1 Tax=Microcoleus sp. PH2017_09_SFU_O_A TaxID=2798820 RepID=UPI001D4EE21F|nr:hypothetical protein [Microcoleus sp. PH2017_09_SFU_O_A]MCC3451845.1 hypothetical protein [Microcoleus sp. PH2017_09_SFU_O_A]
MTDHRAALAWYAGTANLNESQFPSENGETIYRRLGDLAENNIADVTKTWYTPEHTNASLTHGDTKAHDLILMVGRRLKMSWLTLRII